MRVGNVGCEICTFTHSHSTRETRRDDYFRSGNREVKTGICSKLIKQMGIKTHTLGQFGGWGLGSVSFDYVAYVQNTGSHGAPS